MSTPSSHGGRTRLTVLVTPEERELLRQAAAAEGYGSDNGGWLRALGLTRAQDVLDPGDEPQVDGETARLIRALHRRLKKIDAR